MIRLILALAAVWLLSLAGILPAGWSACLFGVVGLVAVLALVRGGTRRPTPTVPEPEPKPPEGGYWIDTPTETEARPRC